jgi:hypothetical protein
MSSITCKYAGIYKTIISRIYYRKSGLNAFAARVLDLARDRRDDYVTLKPLAALLPNVLS